MAHKRHITGVAKNIGRYSDAVEVGPGQRWLFTAGTPGITKTGEIPDDIEGQSRLAWENVVEALGKADMTVDDLVKVTTSLTDAKHIPAYAAIRNAVLGDVRPAFMLQIVSALVWPKMLVEIEVVAAAD